MGNDFETVEEFLRKCNIILPEQEGTLKTMNSYGDLALPVSCSRYLDGEDLYQLPRDDCETFLTYSTKTHGPGLSEFYKKLVQLQEENSIEQLLLPQERQMSISEILGERWSDHYSEGGRIIINQVLKERFKKLEGRKEETLAYFKECYQPRNLNKIKTSSDKVLLEKEVMGFDPITEQRPKIETFGGLSKRGLDQLDKAVLLRSILEALDEKTHPEALRGEFALLNKDVAELFLSIHPFPFIDGDLEISDSTLEIYEALKTASYKTYLTSAAPKERISPAKLNSVTTLEAALTLQ